MNMIFFLIGCSILLALLFLAAFFWASKTGQHDDTYTPSVRILFDDELMAPEAEKPIDQAIEKRDEDHT
ncbi:cbb3-type cytochrome oxidase assembly protein CcoS [Pedobacter psychroterrae]|uniref:Cbb3-type cytochrome oxidase assembly protein CcoS n=1 Tax=Pedobacter psychroterrae TaxID=2530453 RepID=A0A4V2ML85_9SPHI|nr:cbb3-type cytochrome oxidase assembly protein CcoS [Pedobacter psychroterrae]TCD01117.1 cbb3-type cytochrome oxidase assembly protein CcoS [Pedobacter psychroterrae]